MTKKFFLLILALLTIALTASARRVGVFCHMAATGTQISKDGSIRASIVINPEGEAVLEIENLTDKVVFICRKRSFSLINGVSEPMYLRQSNTESHTTQQSVITDEDRLRETKTVQSVSHTNSHTVYDQRVLAIAPHGRSVVYTWSELPRLFRKDIIEIGQDAIIFGGHIGHFMDTGKKFSKGDRRDYTAESTPLMLAADLEYSFNEKGEDAHRLSLHNYVSSIRIGRAKDVERSYMLDSTPYFAFRSGKGVSPVLTYGGLSAMVAAFVYLPFALSKDFDTDSHF